ncbi:MAG: hypothetical protein CVU03_12990 [Bacteroidetes bacterium HGW-Bacteroidetes-2]|jgi:hypothetical protein|nr:MAG: hypothetical protein CVU03_12990 [Bacteroidetes bacterium HGW-Bacteroidetes-2]
MKKPSTELFDLIQVLDPQEKAFITRRMNMNEKESISKKIFLELSNQKVYKETDLLKISSINKKNIKHCKQTLTNSILKSLEVYYADATLEASLNKTLSKIKILRGKKLLTKALKLIKPALKKAENYGFFLIHIQLLAELQFITLENDDIEGFESLRIENSLIYKELIKNYNRFHKNEETISILKKMSLKDGWYPKNQKHSIVHSVYEKNIPIQKTTSKRIILQEMTITYFCLLLMNNYKNSEIAFENFYTFYESLVYKIESPEDYLFHINTGITICVFTHNRVLFDKLCISLNNFFTHLKNKDKKKSVLTNYYAAKNNEIAFLTHHKEFEEAKIRSENLQIQFKTLSIKPSVRKIFWANLCQVYICCKEPSKALKAFNTIKNNSEFTNIRIDIDPGTNILGMAIFYEMNLFDNLESLLRSVDRNSSKKEECKIYKELIIFFKLLISNPNETKLKLIFKNIYSKMEDINQRHPDSLFFLENTLIKVWIEHKLSDFKPNKKQTLKGTS